jgi:hypothetical protein
MGGKLGRNKSDERSRAFWNAVHVAAANAPRLTFPEGKSGEVVTHGRNGRIRDSDVVAGRNTQPRKDKKR